jgi:hypothetical protein
MKQVLDRHWDATRRPGRELYCEIDRAALVNKAFTKHNLSVIHKWASPLKRDSEQGLFRVYLRFVMRLVLALVSGSFTRAAARRSLPGVSLGADSSSFLLALRLDSF